MRGVEYEFAVHEKRKMHEKYPRDLIDEIQTAEDGYLKYRRRKPGDGGFNVIIKVRNVEVDIDNRWIVPCSTILSKTFKAHTYQCGIL